MTGQSKRNRIFDSGMDKKKESRKKSDTSSGSRKLDDTRSFSSDSFSAVSRGRIDDGLEGNYTTSTGVMDVYEYLRRGRRQGGFKFDRELTEWLVWRMYERIYEKTHDKMDRPKTADPVRHERSGEHSEGDIIVRGRRQSKSSEIAISSPHE